MSLSPERMLVVQLVRGCIRGSENHLTSTIPLDTVDQNLLPDPLNPRIYRRMR